MRKEEKKGIKGEEKVATTGPNTAVPDNQAAEGLSQLTKGALDAILWRDSNYAIRCWLGMPAGGTKEEEEEGKAQTVLTAQAGGSTTQTISTAPLSWLRV